MKTITKPDMIIFPKYVRSVQIGTAAAYPKFAAGDSAAAFASRLFEKYVGIISDDVIYPALIFLNNLTKTNNDGAACERSVSLAVRLFFMRLRLREEKNFFGGLTINAEKEVSKSYETILSQIKLRSPDVYYFLSKIGDNVVSELGDTVNKTENNINIILNRLEKKSVYSNAAAQNVLSVFKTVAVQAYKFAYGTHNTEEILGYGTASAERDTHTYDLNSTRVLKEKTVADNSDALTNASYRETNKDDNVSDRIYKIYFTENAKPDSSQVQPQVNIDDFINEKHITGMSAEKAEGGVENSEYVTAEMVLRAEMQSKTVEKISEKHSETISAVSSKIISENTSSLRHFAKNFLCLSCFKKIGIISNERKILFKSTERENNFFTALFTRHSVTEEQSDDHSFERVITERNNTYRKLNRIFNSSAVFSERLIERVKMLGGVEKFVRLKRDIREKSGIFSQQELSEHQIEQFSEHSNTSENYYLENTGTQRFGAERIFNNSSALSEQLIEHVKWLGVIKKSAQFVREKSYTFSREELLEQRIEQFSERLNTSENNSLENTMTQRLGSESIFNSSAVFWEQLIERVKMLGGVKKSARLLREKSYTFSREELLEQQIEQFSERSNTSENNYLENTGTQRFDAERIFNNSSAFLERLVERANMFGIARINQFVRRKNNIFSQKERLEAQSSDNHTNTERIFNNSSILLERLIERVKTLGGAEKMLRFIRVSREARLKTQLSENRTDKQSQLAERSLKEHNDIEQIFNNSAAPSRRFVEHIKTLGSIEKFTQFVRGKNNVFLREERLEAQFNDSQTNDQSQSIERLLTEHNDIERIFNNSNAISERLVERVKTLGSIKKFAQSTREKINGFSLKERLERLVERSEHHAKHHNNVFLTAVFAESHYRRTSEHINTFFRSDRSEFTGSRKYNILDYKIRKLVQRDIAGEYLTSAANPTPDAEKDTMQYGRTVNLNYKSERNQTERQQSAVSKNDLIEQYGNLIDYNVSQPSKSVPAFSLTDAAQVIRSNSEMAAINKANIEQLKEKQIELERNALSRSDADRLYDDFMRKLRQQMRLEKSRFTG